MQVLESPVSVAPLFPSHRTQPARIRDEVTAREAREELQRVIASEDFPASARNRRFLAFAVGRALENGPGGGRVSAWDIAVRVFGRPENFNPIVDPIVRIEAGKLRRDLETYYLKSGRKNPLRIELPLGGYDAIFVRQSADQVPVGDVPPATGNLADDAAAELRRVLESPDFPATPRKRRFLAYVVQKELAGARDEITALQVAMCVLGRGAEFDPNKDPIVRIEAGGLRRDLETYYLKSGSRNPLRINIPKGGYRPAFSYRS